MSESDIWRDIKRWEEALKEAEECPAHESYSQDAKLGDCVCQGIAAQVRREIRNALFYRDCEIVNGGRKEERWRR